MAAPSDQGYSGTVEALYTPVGYAQAMRQQIDAQTHQRGEKSGK